MLKIYFSLSFLPCVQTHSSQSIVIVVAEDSLVIARVSSDASLTRVLSPLMLVKSTAAAVFPLPSYSQEFN